MSEIQVLLMQEGSGAGPWHWQQWLASQLDGHDSAVGSPALLASTPTTLDERLAGLRRRLDEVPEESELVVAAHSDGAALWLHHAAAVDDEARRADRVLLVAPPAPDAATPRDGLTPYPLDAMSLRGAGAVTRMVVGTGDPHLPMHTAHLLAEELQIELDVILDGGHLDTDAGYGPWPAVLSWALYGSVPLGDRFGSEAYTAGYSVEKLRQV